MAKRTFGWCFIGAGKITERVLKDFPLMDGAFLATVYSRTPENAKRTAALAGARACATLEEAVSDPAVQAVYVATTNNMHKEHTLAALRLGKPVLCEKPFALNRAEAQEMIALAHAKNLYLMEAMWTRFNPVIQKGLAWIAEGRIGAVRGMSADFAFQMAKDGPARIQQRAYGGGGLLDLGVYTLALTQFVFGRKPSKISAVGALTDEAVDAQCAMTLQYDDGAIARLFASIEVSSGNDAIIYGEKGKITFPGFVFANTVLLEAGADKDSFSIEKPDDGYHFEFNAVMADILAGRLENEWITHQYTLDLMEIMDTVRSQIGVRYEGE